ncbi:MAG: hypothetical protein ACRETQ_00545 [Gammaproteobacteria bacterium]
MDRSRWGGRVFPAVCTAAGITALILCASARADALGDLRAKLASLDGRAPIQATLTVETTTVSKKENAGKPQTAQARLELRAGDGLSVHVDAATLQQAATELAAATTNATHPTPALSLLRSSVDPVTLAELLSEGPHLLRKLSPATAATVTATTLWGKPAQELTVSLPAPKSSDIKLKDFSDSFSIWLDTGGVPLAASEQTQGKGCFLFLCMRVAESASYTFEVAGGRLLASKLSTEHKQSGLGQDSDTHTVYTLEVQSPAGSTARAGIRRQD